MSEPIVLLQGGRVIDETGERIADVLVRDGIIVEVAAGIDAPAGATVLDAEGAVVAPGLVDLQVHFREPGREDSETIDTGARGAALGGFTAVVCMPNTNPPLDDAGVVQAVLERGRESPCDVRVAGCITRGRAGRELAPLGELYDLGVRVFTDDGDCVADAGVMRRALESYDPNAKVNPPLRTETDRTGVIAGLADGTIDAIATDHAPHSIEEKDVEFEYAPPGLVGLETALALAVTELVEPGHLGLARMVELMSGAPARILGLTEQGSLGVGKAANLVLFDPSAEWTVDPAAFHSKSRNTPFGGRRLKGRVLHTFFRGRPTVRAGRVLEALPA